MTRTARKQTAFSQSPDPAFLYVTPTLEATLHKIRYTIDYRQGLSVILGDVGLGKSSLLRLVHNEYLEREDVRVVMIPSPSFATDFAFVKGLCLELGLPPRRSMLDQEGELRSALIGEYAADRNVVVLIDEAQRLTGKMLEVVRTLLNFETDDAKLVQIILAGQLELRDRLKDPSKKAIRSRIFAPSLLAPLTFEETGEMLRFRCERFKVSNPFTDEAVRVVYEEAGGVPRDTLRLCAHAQAMAQMVDEKTISAELVHAAANEMRID